MNDFLQKIRDVLPEEAFNRIICYMTEAESGCWLWSNSIDRDGYGRITINKRVIRAHRLFWELEHGTIPKGLVIDHICRTRNCVNPNHLRLATPRQNVLENSRSFVAINAQKKFCRAGHPYDKTYTSTEGYVERYCSTCHRNRVQEYRITHRATV